MLPAFLAPLGILAGLSVNLGLWLWTFKVLGHPRGRAGRRSLPGAVVGAIGLEMLKAVGAFYVPGAVASASALYGTLGVVFATLAWLLFFGRLVVYAAVVNVVRWEEDHGTVVLEMEVPRVHPETTTRSTSPAPARPSPRTRPPASECVRPCPTAPGRRPSPRRRWWSGRCRSATCGPTPAPCTGARAGRRRPVAR